MKKIIKPVYTGSTKPFLHVHLIVKYFKDGVLKVKCNSLPIICLHFFCCTFYQTPKPVRKMQICTGKESMVNEWKLFKEMANKILANQMSDNSLENWNWFKLQINGYVKNYTVCMEGLGANGQWSTWLFKYSHKN